MQFESNMGEEYKNYDCVHVKESKDANKGDRSFHVIDNIAKNVECCKTSETVKTQVPFTDNYKEMEKVVTK